MPKALLKNKKSPERRGNLSRIRRDDRNEAGLTLSEYQRKRRFDRTPEPFGDGKGGKMRTGDYLRYVVQKHKASRLHYDFRLEIDGVLKSWAIPKGPSLDPAQKRLAIMTEDHPLDYMTFEGVIPKGNYGAGEVIVWDNGLYNALGMKDPKENKKKIRSGLEKGHLELVLAGKKLKGRYSLVRMKREDDDKKGEEHSWLLVKHEDNYATTDDVTDDDWSVISRKQI